MNRLKKELWETQIDHYLNDETFWIANQDVKELKEWIDEKTGIDVFYGTQFLQSLNDEEQMRYLEAYPLSALRFSCKSKSMAKNQSASISREGNLKVLCQFI